MKTRLGALLLRNMEHQGLDRPSFVRRMGYSNLDKGLRRLDAWLNGGAVPGRQNRGRLCRALDLAPLSLERAIQQDQLAHQEDQLAKRQLDPTYHLILRLMPGIYSTLRLPEGLNEEEARKEAEHQALSLNIRCCLNTPESKNIWIDECGEEESISTGPAPVTTLCNKEFNLQIDDREPF